MISDAAVRLRIRTDYFEPAARHERLRSALQAAGRLAAAQRRLALHAAILLVVVAAAAASMLA